MRGSGIVYRRIVARIALLGFTRREVAEELGVTYGTLHNKLCGVTPFTWDEVRHLVRVLEYTGPLEELLERRSA